MGRYADAGASVNPTRRLLALCARPVLNNAAADAIARHMHQFADWQALPDAAEQENMVPLVTQHLTTVGVQPPPATRRLLAAHMARQRRRSRALEATLLRAVQVCAAHRVPTVLLKGAGLARTLYKNPTLRPMDDIDMLVPAEQVAPLREAFLRAGFWGPPPGGPEERERHAAPIMWTHDDVVTAVEIHRTMPSGGFADSWAQIAPQAIPIANLPGAAVPAAHQAVWQVYHHAFRSSLRWVAWRMIWVADLVGLLERGDWQASTAPLDLRRLSLLHHLTPLSDGTLTALGGPPPPLAGVGSTYHGWPFYNLSPRTLWRALTPSPWWLMLRHGVDAAAAPAAASPIAGSARRHHLRDLWREWRAPWSGL